MHLNFNLFIVVIHFEFPVWILLTFFLIISKGLYILLFSFPVTTFKSMLMFMILTLVHISIFIIIFRIIIG